MRKYNYTHPLKRLRKCRRECRQIIIDTEWWNANRPDSGPMDCEPERVMLVKCDEAIAAWGSPEFGRLASEVVRYAKELMKEEVNLGGEG